MSVAMACSLTLRALQRKELTALVSLPHLREEFQGGQTLPNLLIFGHLLPHLKPIPWTTRREKKLTIGLADRSVPSPILCAFAAYDLGDRYGRAKKARLPHEESEPR